LASNGKSINTPQARRIVSPIDRIHADILNIDRMLIADFELFSPFVSFWRTLALKPIFLSWKRPHGASS
jgi:hypothetical protein